MENIEIKRIDLMAADSDYAELIKPNQREQWNKRHKMVKDTEAAIVRQFLKAGYVDVEWTGRGKTRALSIAIPDGGLVEPDVTKIDKRHTNNLPDYIDDVRALIKDFVARQADNEEVSMSSLVWLESIGVRTVTRFKHKDEVKAASRFIATDSAVNWMTKQYEETLVRRYREMWESARKNIHPLVFKLTGYGASYREDSDTNETDMIELGDKRTKAIIKQQNEVKAKYRELIAKAQFKDIASLKAAQSMEISDIHVEQGLDSFWTAWTVDTCAAELSWTMTDEERNETVARVLKGFKRHMEKLALDTEFYPSTEDKAARGTSYIWADMAKHRENGLVIREDNTYETPFWYLVRTRQYWKFIVKMNEVNDLGKSEAEDLYHQAIRDELKKHKEGYDRSDEVIKMLIFPTFESFIGSELLDEYRNEHALVE